MGDMFQDTGMMIFMDPPRHTHHRTLVSRAFTPRRISDLEPHIRELCASLLDAWDGSSTFDFVQQFGAQLPSLVITDLPGVSLAERTMVKAWIDETFHIEPGVGMINDIAVTAQFKLFEYLEEQLNERVRAPRDDMLTALVQAEVVGDDGVGRTLTIEEAGGFATLLISAGTETVARLLGWAAVVLDAHPEQRAELADDPALIPNAVEELLRY